MHRFSRYLGAVILVSAIGNAARGSAQDAPPVPDDRAGDSFRIYSSLIPLGETASPGWPHDLWLIRDETLEMAKAKQPCNAAEGSALNPHSAVHPSQNQRADFDEILRDFDQHCHERFTLRGGNWSFKERYRLLTPAEQDNFMASRSRKQNPDAPNPFAGAPALYGFSPVYFNAHHTVALVYATHLVRRPVRTGNVGRAGSRRRRVEDTQLAIGLVDILAAQRACRPRRSRTRDSCMEWLKMGEESEDSA